MESDQLELLGENLKAHITDTDLSNKISSGIDFLTVVVDAALQLPVLDTYHKLVDGLNNYKALRLHQKLSKFLFGISDISYIDRQRFMEELDDLHHLKEKSGEVLLDIIDRTNHLGKIDLVINLFKSKIADEIDIQDFLRLTNTLEKLSITDIYDLKSYDLDGSHIPGKYEGSLTDALYSAGVIYMSVIGGNSSPLFKINNLGGLLLRYALITGK